MTDREAYIVLNMISGVGSARLRMLLSQFDTPIQILEQNRKTLVGVKGISDVLAEKISNWRQHFMIEEELELAAKGGVHIITLADSDYPEILKSIYDPPLCLYVRGTMPDFQHNTVAIVGSRRATTYGRRMAQHLTESAVLADWMVISGLAYGIDAVAHQSTLDAGGITVAVLGGGLSRIHPQDNVPLARAIIDSGGALISEYPMRFPVSRQSFPRRNRIVSGLSQAVLVIEAGLNSGALITAELAIDQGKSVFAIPGCVDNPQARGCHKLIKQGARLTEQFQDILEEFEFLPGFDRHNSGSIADTKTPAREYTTPSGITPEEKAIIELLEEEPRSFESLAALSNLPTGQLLGTLMKLEIKMVIVQEPGKIYSLRSR